MSVNTMPERRAGLSERAEQLFEKASTGFLVLLGCAWAFAIFDSRAAGDKVNLVTPATAAVVSALGNSDAPTAAYVTDAMSTAMSNAAARRSSGDETGESGKLRASINEGGDRPGIVKAALAVGAAIREAADFAVITPRPASDVHRGRLGLYYLGSWPGKRGRKGGKVAYDPPNGFIEVTRDNADTRLSEHFRIRDFLTHDQQNVWPKYVWVSLKLVDKLELVLDDLNARGIKPDGVHVMSGFRTPQYNRGGGDSRGRANLSRHMYGDAADIYIDDSGNGSMDDLNHDGRVDLGDARVILAAVDRVERAHPSLVGGCGVYVGNGAHGPFVHIDTRGYPARWIGTGDN
ncbi:MAG: D-Ala-D-Ala carboxypeptidase family metallohydrolase [Gemmatimonadaceae bacterium]